VRAAILRPQLRNLGKQADRWNARYAVLAKGLADTPGLSLTKRPEAETVPRAGWS